MCVFSQFRGEILLFTGKMQATICSEFHLLLCFLREEQWTVTQLPALLLHASLTGETSQISIFSHESHYFLAIGSRKVVMLPNSVYRTCSKQDPRVFVVLQPRLLSSSVSRLGLVGRRSAGKRKDACDLWALSRDFALHN